MSGSNGRQQGSSATEAPAVGERDDEAAMDGPVRLGLVGLGRMGRFHAANLAGRIPGARLVRVTDAAEKVARENADRLGAWSGPPGTRTCSKTRRSRRSSLPARRTCTPGKTDKNPRPAFEDGYRVQAVIDAVERSLESRGWTVPETDTKGGVHGKA